MQTSLEQRGYFSRGAGIQLRRVNQDSTAIEHRDSSEPPFPPFNCPFATHDSHTRLRFALRAELEALEEYGQADLTTPPWLRPALPQALRPPRTSCS